ncbi:MULTISPECIES: hypothetical protein [unclassified Haladaptatus]|uniref:hypothetical protein n=1 Tax=unclassified Haladaptatus TaxID=2622732 RepID=UPI00209C2564|nr:MULTISPECIES: hypothetical protein [unclassified Haladaptatus]MCO8244837.1 hypothetical protein [Haladaptatus sp. AB643]MCO8255649.1 hypothetical protein [Haladaptatus sp. AB618]
MTEIEAETLEEVRTADVVPFVVETNTDALIDCTNRFYELRDGFGFCSRTKVSTQPALSVRQL